MMMKAYYFFLAGVFALLSACGGQGEEEAATPIDLELVNPAGQEVV